MAEESRDKKGMITEDPSLTFKEGQTLKFKSWLFTHQFASKTVWLKEWESFNGVLLSIHFAKNEDHRVEGSAVFVAPGIALCAKHVITPYAEELMSGQIGPAALAISKNGIQTWRVSKLTLINNTDLAILGLTYASALPEENLFNQASISTRLPKKGENLLIAGFRATEQYFQISKGINGENIIEYSGNIICCNGIVTERFPEKRDSGMLPWPTLEVDCPSFGGMSGGPVFDSNGKLIGILSSSMNDGPSYVSLLWPSLAVEFEGGWPSSLMKGKTTLLNLAPNLCVIDDVSAIKISENGTFSYIPWE